MGFSDWLDESTPERREVAVCFDRRLLSALKAARQSLGEHEDETKTDAERTLGERDEIKAELLEEVADLEAQVAAKTHTLVFEGIGWQAWRNLIAAHPPRKDQHEVFSKAVQYAFMPHSIVNLGYDSATFTPAAIAASCVEPGITVEQAVKWIEIDQPGVLDRVWTAVLEVNLAGQDDPFVLPSRNGSSDVHLLSGRR